MANLKKLRSESSPEQPQNDHGGDYAVKKNKTIYLIARILAFLSAFLLWIYVASTNTTTDEQDFRLVPIAYREESILKNEYGLIVQSINIDTLNVTLMGNRTDVRSLSASDVKAYVNLGSITKAGEYELDVYVDVPSGTTCVAQTVDKVMVSVDKPSTKTMPLSADKVVLSGWSLEKDCFFGDITLSAEEVVLEGPTLELAKVADIEVRTDVIGSANAGFTATASVHFIDSEGDEIIDSGVSVRSGNHLQVTVDVLKTVKVELKLEGKNGLLSDELVTLNPSHVWLTGEPKAVEGRKELVIGSIDETELKADTVQTYPLVLDGIKITDGAGEEITSVSASIQVSVLPTRTFTGLPILRDRSLIGYITLDVRAVSSAEEAKLKTLTSYDITVHATETISANNLDGLVVTLAAPYDSIAYVVSCYDFERVS